MNPDYIRILRIFNKDQKKGAALALLTLCVSLILEIASLFSLMPFLSIVANPKIIKSNDKIRYVVDLILPNLSTDEVLIYLGLFCFFFILISTIIRIASTYYLNNFIEKFRYDISLQLFKKFISNSFSFFLEHKKSDLLKIIMSDVDRLIGDVIRPMFMLISYSLLLVVIGFFLLIYNPFILVAAFSFLFIIYFLLFYLIKKRISLLGESLLEQNEIRFSLLKDVFDGIKYFKFTNKYLFFLKRFEISTKKVVDSLIKHTISTQAPNFLSEFLIISSILLYVIFLVKVNGSADDSFSSIISTLTLYAIAMYKVKPSIQNIFSSISSIRFSFSTVDLISSKLTQCDYQEEIVSSTRFSLKEKLSFKNVSFTYPGGTSPVFGVSSLDIYKGQTIGIIGSSGSGKTTFVDLFSGLLYPTHGNIYVDEKRLSSKNSVIWRSSIGYVPQEVNLHESSFLENIAFGFDPSEIDKERVITCARMVHLHDELIVLTKQGYNTVIGSAGVGLSGGQKQRLGIARALYTNPDILIFDESTSALDETTELNLINMIYSLSRFKTVLIITHKKELLYKCDMVYEIDNGKIANSID